MKRSSEMMTASKTFDAKSTNRFSKSNKKIF
jgi:hypothetical protein